MTFDRHHLIDSAPRIAPSPAPRAGGGTPSGDARTGGHHGEILQGAFAAANGRLCRALVTLPCPLICSKATVHLRPSDPVVECSPAWRRKSASAVRLTLDTLGLIDWGADLEVSSNIEVGLGLGSSSSDVTSAIKATFRALKFTPPDALVAQLAVEAEVASDPLMYDETVLFAHRRGSIVERFDGALPPMLVLGFRVSSGRVDTVATPPARYCNDELDRLDEARRQLRSALAWQDLASVGRVATESAQLNQRFVPLQEFDELLTIARQCQAAGVQLAHSGGVGGLIFPCDAGVLVDQARAELRSIGVSSSWVFSPGPFGGPSRH